MEQTLDEKLYDLQLYTAQSLGWSNLEGNKPGRPYFRIYWMHTSGGEQFTFKQVDALGIEGSGAYFRTRPEIIEYAQRQIALFMQKFRKYDPTILDADWHKEGNLFDAV